MGDEERWNRSCCERWSNLWGSGPGHRRYVVALMICLGMTSVMIMRCELGMAILVLNPEVANGSTLARPYSGIDIRIKHWSHTKVAVIEAALFLGYAVFSVPGGLLATLYRPHVVFGCAILVTSAINLLITTAVYLSHSFILVAILRVAQGAAEGCLLPTAHALFRYWAPLSERSRLVSISFFGLAIGPIVGYPLTGYLIETFNWCTPFYVYGIMGLLWVLLWFFCIRSRPMDDPIIQPEELAYIMSSAGSTDEDHGQSDLRHIPWKSMFTSLPVWAIVVANMGRNWFFQFSFSGLPKYFSDLYHLTESDIGLHMMPGYILIAVLTLLGGFLADLLYRTTRLSLGKVRKIINTIGFTVTSLCFLLLAFSRVLWLSTLLLSWGLGFLGIGMSGFGVNHLDIAPAYAGILMGLSAGVGTLSGIFAPLISMHIVKIGLAHEWMKFFVISATINIFCGIVYACFSSGEVQQWATGNTTTVASFEPILQGRNEESYGAVQNTDLGGTDDYHDKYPIVHREMKME